jgi:methionyl-tRNA formyltransferase
MTEPRSLRILFAGTPDFSVPPLEALIEGGFKPIAIYTQPDRPAETCKGPAAAC